MIATLRTLDGKVTRETLKSPGHPKGAKFAQVAGSVEHNLTAVEVQSWRENVQDLEPGERKEFLVAHFECQVNRFAQEGTGFTEFARVVQAEEAKTAPDSTGGDDHKERHCRCR